MFVMSSVMVPSSCVEMSIKVGMKPLRRNFVLISSRRFKVERAFLQMAHCIARDLSVHVGVEVVRVSPLVNGQTLCNYPSVFKGHIPRF